MPTIADAHLRTPKVHGPDVSVGAARVFFTDSHVHALLLVERGVLVSVVERDDLEVELTMPMIGLLKRKAEKHIINLALTELKERAEG